MLSSAPKSVPTREQFIQPYFIEIDSDGAIKATCARFAALLKKRDIFGFLERNILEIFAQLGKLSPKLPDHFPKETLPKLIDLSLSAPTKPFLIRWIMTPAFTSEGETGNWQLSGMKIYSNDLDSPSRTADTRDHSRPVEEDWQYQASLVRYVSDIIVTTDLQDQIIYWNKAAEKFYGISADRAIGQHFRELVRYEYLHTTEDAVKKVFREKGFWDGEAIYVQETEKNRTLLVLSDTSGTRKNGSPG